MKGKIMTETNRDAKSTQLKKLTEQFKSNISQYKSNVYDEANTRIDFIDKFFEILDWDVRNEKGWSEDYREVVREDTVYIAGKPKAPDYSFRIGGRRKFFVEAKRPSVDIKKDIKPAFQVRRYGYSAKLPLSVLTDFEEFSVYDTRIKPHKNDKADVARIFYCTYEEYEKHFDFLYSTFSNLAIQKGSFDTYVTKRKKGTSEIDAEFLKLIDSWRIKLAENIALRNNLLDAHHINRLVQKIIDRLIFLRIAEDRNTEKYGMLKEMVKGEALYQLLTAVFTNADKKYNSGLFEQEEFISEVGIDDKVIKTIVSDMYPPDCPYEFSVMPIEILGHIYEQFLGKTIRLTEGHHAKVEAKPEVRKAGGVYYTPQYIVDYIVENTLGEKLKVNSLFESEGIPLRILDPACGSGSFLIGAYGYLLRHFLEYYTGEKTALKSGKIYLASENTYRLSIKEKRRILLDHIYGVDIDTQAVEVTKLSLLLKLMEGEQPKTGDFKFLPNLSANIKCGNSLIGTDYYDDKDMSKISAEEIRKINAFDWEKEFPHVFK